MEKGKGQTTFDGKRRSHGLNLAGEDRRVFNAS